MRLDGYIRVSRIGGRQGEGYISPEVQREAIERYADEIGGEIVNWSDDQDYSGGTTERPGFQAALERIRGGDSDGIVVMRIDRFARSVADGSQIVRELKDAGKVFASCHERIDPRTPEGNYMLNAFLNNGELFLNQTKAQWETTKTRAVARGVHIGPTPIGYQRKKSQPLEIDPRCGPAIRGLFERAATGKYGDTDLARWMDEVAPRGNARPYQPSEIRRWLKNRVYLGEVHYGDLVNHEAHPPLTDEATWRRCQREPGELRRAESPFLLRGLIRCANCRYTMGGQSGGGRDGRTPVYRCAGGRGCDSRSVINAAKVEGHVVGLVRKHLDGLRLEAIEDSVNVTELEARLEDAETELAAFASDLDARRMLGEGGWRDALRTRSNARDDARRDLEQAQARLATAEVTDLNSLSEHDLRDLLGGMVRHIFVRRGRGLPDSRVLVIWADDDPVETPAPHRGGVFKPVEW